MANTTSISQFETEAVVAGANASISQFETEAVVAGANASISQLTIELVRTNPTSVPSGGTFEAGTFGGLGITYYLVPQLSDYDIELRDHQVKAISVTGKFTSANVGVFGYGVEESINIATIEAGNINANTNQMPIDNTTQVTVYPRLQCNVPNSRLSTMRIEGQWDGEGLPDQIHELRIESAQQGIRR